MLARVRDLWVRASLAVSVGVAAFFLVAAWGVKFGLIDWRAGYRGMALEAGPYVLAVAAALAGVGLALAFAAKPARGWLFAAGALLVPLAGFGVMALNANTVSSDAPITDITTDFLEPPAFSEPVIAARAATSEALSLDVFNARVRPSARFEALGGKRMMQAQIETYPDLASIPSGMVPADVFDMAFELARQQGWKLGAVDKDSGRIEATDETFWFGFKDDIVIRVRPDGAGTRVDMRSVSRLSVSDPGTNARRVIAYMSELRTRIEYRESLSQPSS